MPITYDPAKVLETQVVATVRLYRIVIDAEREVVQYRYRALDSNGNTLGSPTVEVSFTTLKTEKPQVVATVQKALKDDGYSRAPFPTGVIS